MKLNRTWTPKLPQRGYQELNGFQEYTNKQLRKSVQNMRREFNKDAQILKKSKWNSGKEKLNKSNKNTQLKASPVDWTKLKLEYQGLKTR
jgi:hypothetical protein